MNQDKIRQAIKGTLSNLKEQIFATALETYPLVTDTSDTYRRFCNELIPDVIFKGAHFERQFIASLDLIWRSLVVVIAESVESSIYLSPSIQSTVAEQRLRRIQSVLNRVESSARKKSEFLSKWVEEVNYVQTGNGDPIPVAVTCDVLVIKNNNKYAFELKTSFPNKYQIKSSKEKLLKLHAMEPPQVLSAHLVLPYGTYTNSEDSNIELEMENSMFLMENAFWDFIGGEGTFHIIKQTINEIRKGYKEQVYRDYLGIEPPYDSLELN